VRSASIDVPGKISLANAMRQLAGGVCVITAGRAPLRTGYTGTAVFSLSIDPERIVISIGRDSSYYPAIRDFGDFGLNVLSGVQQPIADRFAGRGGVKGETRYEGADWRVSPRGVSLLAGALAAVECRVEEIIERHSHALVIGEPLAIETGSSAEGLIYWRAGYAPARGRLPQAAE
jgi:flavin reductase (DIM6/NTAB) family NADH-FMN oxidoreductase RutF